MIELRLPLNETAARSLRIGDELLLSGTIVTARDAAHKLLVEEKPEWPKPILKDTMIYHCGPIVRQDTPDEWTMIAAGPTTSIREEPYQAEVIQHYGLRGIIGKGGMGEKTLQALQDCGAVYLHACGGAAALLGARVKKVKNVYMLDELGVPEAFWQIEVVDFPVLVTMDSTGASLHGEVETRSRKMLHNLLNTPST